MVLAPDLNLNSPAINKFASSHLDQISPQNMFIRKRKNITAKSAELFEKYTYSHRNNFLYMMNERTSY